MAGGGARALFVPMDEILDAMDTHGAGVPSFFLDTGTGHVSLCLAGTDTGGDNAVASPGFERIPEYSPGRERAAMEGFVGELEAAEVRGQLERALRGRAAPRRFRDTVAAHPDLHAAWLRAKREDLLQDALAWLNGLGIEPQYELRPIRPPRSAGQDRRPGAGQVGLLDLLLLGAPDGQTAFVEGRVERRLQAADSERARTSFATLARQLCEHHGVAWRGRFIEGIDRYEIDRFRLTIAGATVTLSVAVSNRLWSAFRSEKPQRNTEKI